MTVRPRPRRPPRKPRPALGAGLSSDPVLRVGRVLHGTSAEGPGRRTAIWVQGCSIRCRGCINPQLFDARGGEAMQPEDIAAAAADHGDEGLTLLGGEPFDQAAACARLCEAARERGLGVICFTGYTLESLRERGDAGRMLGSIDLLVDGPYLADQPETERALVGSSNQRFVHLTDRYADYDPARAKNRVELRITPQGHVEVAGFLERDPLAGLTDSLEARRAKRDRKTSA